MPQLYFRKISLYDNKPLKQLAGFTKLFLNPGESRPVTLSVPVSGLKYWNSWKKRFEVESGEYAFWIGESSAGPAVQPVRIQIGGEWDAPI